MDELKNSQLIVKSNQLIESSYRLSTQEQRLILLAAAMISAEDEDFKLYRININEFIKLVGLVGHSKYEEIKNMTANLLTKPLVIREGGNELQLNWFSSAEYFSGQGYVELEFSPKLKPYLLHLKERFTKFQLKHVIRLRRSYSIRIYELLKQYERLGERTLDLDDLRKILWIKDSEYKLYGDIKRKIIKPAQKELKERTDICFDFEEQKQGKKVVAIRFVIKPNKISEEKIIEILGLEIKNQELYRRLQDYFCLSPPQAQDVLTNYPEKQILENLAYVEAQIKQDKVENIGAYTFNAIKNNYQLQMSLFDIEKQQTAEKRKKKEEEKRALEKLESEYEIFKKEAVRRFLDALSGAKLEELRNRAHAIALKKHGPGIGLSTMTNVEMRKLAVEKIGFPSFEEWRTQEIINV